jgi:hypothetical protein
VGNLGYGADGKSRAATNRGELDNAIPLISL